MENTTSQNTIKKIVYFIGGIGGVGKSTAGQRIAEITGAKYFKCDDVYKIVKDKLGIKQELLVNMPMPNTWNNPKLVGLKNWGVHKTAEECVRQSYLEYFNYLLPDKIILEGEAIFINGREMKLLTDIFDGYEFRYIMVYPDYDRWLKNRSKRLGNPIETMPRFMERGDYNRTCDDFLKSMPITTVVIRDLKQIETTDMGTTEYQGEDFSSPKWEKFCFPSLKDKTFFEISCNTGWFLKEAQQRGAITYGLDISWRLLDETLNKVSGCQVYLSKIEDFIFPQKFDFILCCSAFHYYTYREAVIKKISEATDYFILELPLLEDESKNDIHYQGGDDGEFCALLSKPLIIKWLTKYFTNVEHISNTDTPNGRPRPVFKCTK